MQHLVPVLVVAPRVPVDSHVQLVCEKAESQAQPAFFKDFNQFLLPGLLEEWDSGQQVEGARADFGLKGESYRAELRRQGQALELPQFSLQVHQQKHSHRGGHEIIYELGAPQKVNQHLFVAEQEVPQVQNTRRTETHLPTGPKEEAYRVEGGQRASISEVHSKQQNFDNTASGVGVGQEYRHHGHDNVDGVGEEAQQDEVEHQAQSNTAPQDLRLQPREHQRQQPLRVRRPAQPRLDPHQVATQVLVLVGQ